MKTSSKILIIVMLLALATSFLVACQKQDETKVMEITSADELKTACEKGGEYTLKNDVTSANGYEIAEDITLTIQMCGHKIVCSNDGASIYNKGKLSLYGGIIYSTNTDAQSRMAIKNEGEVYVEEMTIGSKNSRGNGIRNFGTASAKRCTFDCCDNYLNGEGYAYPIANSAGTLTIDNCSYLGSANGIFAADGGNIVVNGGNYALLGDKSYYVFYIDEGKITINDGVFIKIDTKNKSMAYSESGVLSENLVINGGDFRYNGEIWQK